MAELVEDYFSSLKKKYKFEVLINANTFISVKILFEGENSQSGIYIVGAYIPTGKENGQYLDTIFEYIEQLLIVTENIILCGDLNLHLASLASARDIGIDKWTQNPVLTASRLSNDTKKDNWGKTLVKLCEDNSLIPLNGNCRYEHPGNYTFISANGTSVVDYVITTSSIINSFYTLSW